MSTSVSYASPGDSDEIVFRLYSPGGDPLYIEGDDKAFINFQPDIATGLVHGSIGFQTAVTIAYSLQIINSVTGGPIVLETTDGGPIIAQGGPLEVHGPFGGFAIEGLDSTNSGHGTGGCYLQAPLRGFT